MISIIICSRTRDIDSVLRKNISDTIGTEFEIVCIDNSKSQYSLYASTYNRVAKWV